jgi:hypothetical protein
MFNYSLIMGNNTPSHGRNSHEREAEVDARSITWTTSAEFYGPNHGSSRDVVHRSRSVTHKSLPKSSKIAPITSGITYRRNKHGNYQIHCSHHRFPAFIFDTIRKVIIGTQHEDEIYALTNEQKNICDNWGLAYGDICVESTPPSYEPPPNYADVMSPDANISPLQKPEPSASYINPFDFTIHAPLFHHEK